MQLRARIGCTRQCRPASTQHGLDSRKEFIGIERLRQVVVGAELEPRDTFGDRAARADENHRNVVAGRAQGRERGQPVRVRHHDVQHDHRWPFEFEPAPKMRAVMQDGRIESIRLKEAGQQIAYDRVVVDYQNLGFHFGFGADGAAGPWASTACESA